MSSRTKSKKRRSIAPATSKVKNHVRDIYRIRGVQGEGAEALGLREQNKVDKLQRIYLAARRQFAEVGYDGTTLRDIAKEARVALGTLGFYAENKRELVLLIFNELMPAVLERCREAGTYEGSLVDAVVAYFRPAYTAYAEDAGLFRTILRENVFHTTSPHAREFQRLRLETMNRLRDLIAQARDAGEIMPYIDVDLAVRTIFYLMFASVRWWLHNTDRPAVEAGLAELRAMTALLLDGLKSDAAKAATAVRRPAGRSRR